MFWKYLVKKVMESPVPTCRKRGCLNDRHRLSNCNRCIEICPQSAITWKMGIKIDEERCDGCGICIPVCPSQGLEPYRALRPDVYRKIKDQSLFALGCAQSPTNEVHHRLSCIRSLSWEFLAAASFLTQGTVYLDLRGCPTCPRSAGEPPWEDQLERARSFVAATQNALAVQVVGPDETSPLRQTTFSRAEFFGFFQQETQRIVDEVSGDYLNREAISPRRVLAEVSQGRKLHVPLDADPFVDWQVGASCNACGFCQGICPWQAWELTQERTQLYHHPWRCRNCGLCGTYCLEKALTREPLSLLPKPQAKVLKRTFAPRHCLECKAPLTKSDHSDRCMNCQQRSLAG